MNRNNKQAGFTLIELIVVIVILGILAAVALPRFVDLQHDARVAKLNGARGAVQAAAALVHGSALARAGQPALLCPATGTNLTVSAAGAGNVCTETGSVAVINWYPQASFTGIIAAAGLTSINPPTNAALNVEGYNTAGSAATIGSVISIQVQGGSSATTCFFTYSPSTGGVVRTGAAIGAIAPASANGDTSGC